MGGWFKARLWGDVGPLGLAVLRWFGLPATDTGTGAGVPFPALGSLGFILLSRAFCTMLATGAEGRFCRTPPVFAGGMICAMVSLVLRPFGVPLAWSLLVVAGALNGPSASAVPMHLKVTQRASAVRESFSVLLSLPSLVSFNPDLGRFAFSAPSFGGC